jgi:CheY-like chemotaxis protein
VKGILDLHKGAISVFSAGEGFGTCFTFEVPMLRHPYSEVIESSMRINIPRRESEKKKQRADVCRDYEFCDLIGEGGVDGPNLFISAMHILIVDDSKMNRKMVSKFLKGDDYLCDEAEDGLEAIRMVKENLDTFERGEIRKPYHAILMDSTMPLCNGPTATMKIREMGYSGEYIHMCMYLFK